MVPADKGFIDAFRQFLLEDHHGVKVVTPPRQGMTTSHAPELLRICKRLRKRIETVGSQLTGWFEVTQIRVRDLWHYQHRLIRKVLARTIGGLSQPPVRPYSPRP